MQPLRHTPNDTDGHSSLSIWIYTLLLRALYSTYRNKFPAVDFASEIFLDVKLIDQIYVLKLCIQKFLDVNFKERILFPQLYIQKIVWRLGLRTN